MSRPALPSLSFFLPVVLAGIAGGFFAAPLAQDPDLESVLESASRALAVDDLELVESRSSSLLTTAPTDDVPLRTSLCVLLAEARVGMGDATAALEALSGCPRTSLESTRVLEVRASVLATLGRAREAEPILERLVTRRESSGAAHQLGTLRYERGDHRGALKAFKLAIELDAEDYYSRVYAARTCIELGELDDARAHLLTQAKRAGSPELEYLLGRVEERAGRLAEAIAHFRRALQGQPDYLECEFALGGALRARGETAEARRSLSRFRELHHADWRRLQRAGELAQACAREPRNPEAWLKSARFHLSTADGEAARAAAWKALRLEPAGHEARLVLARALRANGRYSAALGHLRKILRAKPGEIEAERELRDLVRKHARR